MFIYFCLYCFLGYLMESMYISLFQRRFVSSGLLEGPYIPLYGIGSIVLIILSSYINHPILLFIIGGIAMTTIEYISSLFIERYFHTKCWDYSHFKFHFEGRICLFYFIVWSLLSVLFVLYIHPFMIHYIPINDMSYLISIMYFSMIIKAFIEIIQKNKESNDSLS